MLEMDLSDEKMGQGLGSTICERRIILVVLHSAYTTVRRADQDEFWLGRFFQQRMESLEKEEWPLNIWPTFSNVI